MTEQERFEKNLGEMKVEMATVIGVRYESWELFFLENIARSLAIITDRLANKSEEDGNDD